MTELQNTISAKILYYTMFRNSKFYTTNNSGDCIENNCTGCAKGFFTTNNIVTGINMYKFVSELSGGKMERINRLNNGSASFDFNKEFVSISSP